MNIIKAARSQLGLSQSAMAAWISKHSKRPCNPKQVSDWECRRKHPRRHVRDVVAYPAAAWALAQWTGRSVPTEDDDTKIKTIMELIK